MTLKESNKAVMNKLFHSYCRFLGLRHMAVFSKFKRSCSPEIIESFPALYVELFSIKKYLNCFNLN